MGESSIQKQNGFICRKKSKHDESVPFHRRVIVLDAWATSRDVGTIRMILYGLLK